jgi:hypothetical protein
MRSLSPGSQQTLKRVFEVIKPLEVEVGIAQPWFGQPGGGIQYRTPVDLDVLLRRGILREISSCGRRVSRSAFLVLPRRGNLSRCLSGLRKEHRWPHGSSRPTDVDEVIRDCAEMA